MEPCETKTKVADRRYGIAPALRRGGIISRVTIGGAEVPPIAVHRAPQGHERKAKVGLKDHPQQSKVSRSNNQRKWTCHPSVGWRFSAMYTREVLISDSPRIVLLLFKKYGK